MRRFTRGRRWPLRASTWLQPVGLWARGLSAAQTRLVRDVNTETGDQTKAISGLFPGGTLALFW